MEFPLGPVTSHSSWRERARRARSLSGRPRCAERIRARCGSRPAIAKSCPAPPLRGPVASSIGRIQISGENQRDCEGCSSYLHYTVSVLQRKLRPARRQPPNEDAFRETENGKKVVTGRGQTVV